MIETAGVIAAYALSDPLQKSLNDQLTEGDLDS